MALNCSLERLRGQKLFVNRNKCSIAQSKVEYLRHVTPEEGVATNQSKIVATNEPPGLRMLRELQGFLGLTRYYKKVRGWVQQVSMATEKGNFGWNEAAEEAFQKLKKAIVAAPVLVLPDFITSFIIGTDASRQGLGAVLMQGHRPSAYYSHVLKTLARSKSIYEL